MRLFDDDDLVKEKQQLVLHDVVVEEQRVQVLDQDGANGQSLVDCD